ncbi:MAG: hypothetical protein AB1505_23150 [Candidatus Latescibacterota bacterium]
MRAWFPYALLVAGLLILLAALASGLARFGWAVPVPDPGLLFRHGALMVGGVLGTLVALERALALGSRWALPAPLLCALGGLGMLALPGSLWPPVLITLGSTALVSVYALGMQREPGAATAAGGLGALLWLTGNALWVAQWPLFVVTLWWLAFLLLNLTAAPLQESLESGLGPLVAYLAATGLLVLGLLLDTAGFVAQWRVSPSALPLFLGQRPIGLALLSTALWMGWWYRPGPLLRQGGAARFGAVCLLSGYAWLAASGLVALLTGQLTTGPYRDVALHAFFTGFVAAAVFGGAPRLRALLLGRPAASHPILYLALAALQLGMVLRIAGDLAGVQSTQQWGGGLSAAAVLLGVAGAAWGSRRAVSAAAGQTRPAVG